MNNDENNKEKNLNKNFLGKKTERPEGDNINEENSKKMKNEEVSYNFITIRAYKENKIKEWEKLKNEDFNLDKLKNFVTKIYDINNESQSLYLKHIITIDNNKFITHYSKYQFVINLNTRKELQNEIKKVESFNNISMIKNNMIPEEYKTIRNILINVLQDILLFEGETKSIDSDLINMFIKNHIYFNSVFNYLIPTRFSENIEYKYNKLLFDISHFLFPWDEVFETKNLTDEEKNSISQKIHLFDYLSDFVEKMNLLNDSDLINNCDFLFNLLEIINQIEWKKRDYTLFEKIITMCYPFDLDYAKSQLKEMKKLISLYSCLTIDNIKLKLFDIDKLKEDSKITLKRKDDFEITVKANEINWYLGKSLVSYFNKDDTFMICFIYKACLNKNYLKIEPIKTNFEALFKKVIKSEIVKEAMTKDSDAKLLGYPFNNDMIIEECEEAIHFVPFPVRGFYGLTDKNSFNTYIYSNISVNNIINVLTEYDNILKTKTHEYKHISRIYYHLFNCIITLHTPKTKYGNKNSLIKDQIKIIDNKKQLIQNAIQSTGGRFREINDIDLDYGDIFELFLIGNKFSQFYLANSVFCLKEKSWNKTPKKFFEDYIASISQKNVIIQKNKNNYIFITCIINYFKFDSGKEYDNIETTKDASKDNFVQNNSNEYPNIYTYIEKYSHCNFKK